MRLFHLFLIAWLASASYSIQRNIILIITDDQDVELGSMEAMPKTTKLLKEKGIYFSSGYVTTPICCPSRTTILTGLYVHNHHVHTNNCNCSGTEWKKTYEPNTFASYLQAAGYRTAYLGKYLNEYEGDYIPPGWDHWMGLVKNSKFYNYSVNFNGVKERFGFDYSKDYFTDLVTNRTVDFILDHMKYRPWQPLLTVVSYPAPHGPEDPAPQYADLFEDITSHRTESWNYAPNPDKQWILQRTGKMEAVHVAFTDILQRRRLQTLQSVDDGVQRIFSALREHNQISNSYVLFTSDHGYHLGQFGLIKGKNMPYEFDIRVPYFLRGPSIPKNITLSQPVSNVDIFPTLLDIAGTSIPDTVDGRSILELVKLLKVGAHKSQLEPWRDTLLIERGKMPKLKKIRERFLKQKEKFNKERRLNLACSRKEFHSPCEGSQLWQCYQYEGRWRIVKCRDNHLCNCDESKVFKRSVDQPSTEEEFLTYLALEELANDSAWKQGDFELPVSKRRSRRSCSCSNNSTHPLKNLEDLELEAIASERHTKLSKKKLSPTSPRSLCTLPQMNCFSHGANHWRTPPLWPDAYGDFCFCQNSNNNTYWCLRTINEHENYLYCEFVTDFVSFYDMKSDPHQLNNIVFSLNVTVLEELNQRLQLLRQCKGIDCDKYSSSDWEQHISKTSIDLS